MEDIALACVLVFSITPPVYASGLLEARMERKDKPPKLDSTAIRLSWNPTSNWSLQASWADVKSPEQLEPQDDLTKWSASAIYTVPFGPDGW